jgi:hypothetical protein
VPVSERCTASAGMNERGKAQPARRRTTSDWRRRKLIKDEGAIVEDIACLCSLPSTFIWID